MSITSRFCALCGKEIQSGVFCSDCSVEARPPKIVRVRECSKCGRVYHSNKLVNMDIADFLKQTFGENTEADVTKFVCKYCNPKQYKANVQIRGYTFNERMLGHYEEYVKEVITRKEGTDIHFTNAGKSFDFVREFRQNHDDCTFKKSTTLVTQRKDGKKLYRPTFLLRKKD